MARPVAAAARMRSVCRERNAGILQDIGDFGHRLGLSWLVDIGQDGNTEFLFDARQNAEADLEPGSAEGLDGGAVGLVKRRLENQRDRAPHRDVVGLMRDTDGMVFTLDDTGAGDEHQWLALTEPHPSHGDLTHGHIIDAR